MKKTETGRECVTYGARDAYKFRWAHLTKREIDHLEDAGVNGTIILKGIFKLSVGGTDVLDLPQDRDRWRALVNAVMNLR